VATAIPQNRAPFTVEEIAAATGGTILESGPPSAGVCTDSRAALPGSAFVALAGERFDGHAFLAQVAAQGARTLVVSRADTRPAGCAVVSVRDTKVALGDLSRAHRVRWSRAPAPGGGARVLVAVTGSAGKTTTKKVIACLLEEAMPNQVHATVGNLNNDVGLPMTLLGLEERHRFAVVEMGTNAKGEIARLAAIALPDAGVVTLVAAAHTEGLGTLEEVALEKGALLEAVSEQGLAVANADDERAKRQLGRTRARSLKTYGTSLDATYRVASRRTLGPAGATVVVERSTGHLEVTSPLLGESGALAVAAGLCVAESVLGRELSAAEATSALAKLRGDDDGRLSPRALADGTLVIDDSYNANPASMRSSIAAAAEIARAAQRPLVLVLGEMRELGALARAEHETAGKLAAESGARLLVAVGGEAAHLDRAARALGATALFVQEADEAARVALDRVRPDDVVLVKGSRGVRTEKVVEALLAARGGAP
jgi:UDP-N-acetylmuramoyl-tripeptide--D-alanyl-D-alanine ligase